MMIILKSFKWVHNVIAMEPEVIHGDSASSVMNSLLQLCTNSPKKTPSWVRVPTGRVPGERFTASGPSNCGFTVHFTGSSLSWLHPTWTDSWLCGGRREIVARFQCFRQVVLMKSCFVLLDIEPVAVYKSQVARASLRLNHFLQITLYTPLHGF